MSDTPKNCSTIFKIGDIVIATDTIHRADGRSHLRSGDKATVRSVHRTTPKSPQIIGLEIEDQMPMGDIVCFEDVPLKLAPKPAGTPVPFGYNRDELDRDNPYTQHIHE